MDTVVVFSPAPGPGGPVAASWQQSDYRFYDDDGTDATSTATAAINTAISLGLDTTKHIRFVIKETAGSNQGEQPFFELCYRINTGGGFGAWTRIGTDSVNDDPVKAQPSTNITNDTHITQRLGSGTFRDGVELDNVRYNSSVGGGTLTATQGNDEYEMLYAIELPSDTSGTPAASGDQIELRLEYNYDEIWRGDPLESYVNYPVINVP